MFESKERFVNGLSEARRQPGVQPEFHSGKEEQSQRVEEQSDADKMKQIVIELTNMPVLVLEVSGSKRTGTPESINSDIRIGLLDIIEIILKMIVDAAKAMSPKRKEKH